jgi:hypothetical protein
VDIIVKSDYIMCIKHIVKMVYMRLLVELPSVLTRVSRV